MKLKVCRLHDGTEIIGTVKPVKNGKVAITDPLQIVFQTRTIHGGNITLTRFMPFNAKHTCSLPAENLIVEDLDPDMVPYYLDCLNFIKKNTDVKLRVAAKKAAGLIAHDAISEDTILTDDEAFKLLLKSIPNGTEH